MNWGDIEDTAISVITKMHERYDTHDIEDTTYIPMIKSVIEGSIEFANDKELPAEVITKITNVLYEYAKSLYIQGWLIRSGTTEDPEQDLIEANAWYDYIYKHEEHPE